MIKKKLIISVIILSLVVTAGVGSVIAYFASISGPVVNTFTVGQVELELADAEVGVIQLVPGTTAERTSVVTVKRDSEDCYVYVKIEQPRELTQYTSYELAEGWINLGGIDGVYYRQVPKSAVNMKYHVFKNDEIAIATHEIKTNLAKIVQASAKLLKFGGKIFMVHRSDRLASIMFELKKNKLEPKVLRVVYPKKNKEPNLVLIEAKKGAKEGLKIKEPLILNNDDGSETDELKKIYCRKN